MRRRKGFTHATFSAVSSAAVSDIRLTDVGHYVAQDPKRLADALLGLFAPDPAGTTLDEHNAHSAREEG